MSKLDFDFDHELPAGKEWFSILWLAKHWGKSRRHVANLVESGEIRIAVDLRGKNAKRSDIIIPRKSVVKFLDERGNA